MRRTLLSTVRHARPWSARREAAQRLPQTRRTPGRTTVALAGAIAVLGTTFTLVACRNPNVDSDDYFPLQAGLSWTYRLSLALDDHDRTQETLTIHNRPSEALNSDPAVRRHASSGIDYWLRSDRTGIYRVAQRTPLDRDAQADDPHRYVLAKPYAVGTSWKSWTNAFVLQRRSEVPKEVRRFHKNVPMTYTIEALDDKVEVPAGQFERCLRVAGQAAVRLYVDAQFAWREIPLLTREWYCAGVGLVKVERVEASPSRFMLGGRVDLELTQWE